jgi:hypothetical protein
MLTWLIAILAALLLYLMPVQYEAGGDPSDLTTAPPPTVTFIGDDISDP